MCACVSGVGWVKSSSSTSPEQTEVWVKSSSSTSLQSRLGCHRDSALCGEALVITIEVVLSLHLAIELYMYIFLMNTC